MLLPLVTIIDSNKWQGNDGINLARVRLSAKNKGQTPGASTKY